MSPPFSFTSSIPDDASHAWGFRLPQQHDHYPGYPQQNLLTENRDLYDFSSSIPENVPSFSDMHYPNHSISQAYCDPVVPGPLLTTNTISSFDCELWSASTMQPVGEVSPPPLASTAWNERSSNQTSLASCFAHSPAHNATECNNLMAVDPLTARALPLFTHSGQNEDIVHDILGQPGSHSLYPRTLCTAYSQHPHSGLSVLYYSPSHRSFNPTSLRSSPHTSTHVLRPTSCRVPRANSTGLTRRGRVSRAIEYHGLWLDEEELLKGLTDPNGKLTVHQCHLEEEYSPCHLWITGDKSCINAHIQKWHGGKPGGDKSQVHCRWSACGKTMLKESIARHILTIHLDELWECRGCGKQIARDDAYGRHAAKSDVDACRTSGALITYSGDAREIDARAALENGGKGRYAGV